MRLLLIGKGSPSLRFFKKSLEGEFYTVDVCHAIESGLSMARVNTYDFIVVDDDEIDGAGFCCQLRQLGKTIPIIVLVSSNETEPRIKLLNFGADDCLAKPFSFEELFARIRAILRRPNQVEPDLLVISDLTIDLANHATTRSGQSIFLTKKEYELLAFLGRNRGKVLSRGSIMEHVWDMNADIFSNTLETHILNLRRKIDNNFETKLIHTMPGWGYKLDTKK